MDKQKFAEVLRRAEQRCAERGAKLTTQRRTVLELLWASDTPLSAYELLDRMRAGIRNPAPPTVYRALDFLLEQGLAHKLESLHAFVGCTHPDHPHAGQFLICAACGDVAELENQAVMQSLRSAAMAIGFETRRPVVELLGTCAQCARKQL
ncbi:Fur family transcriptional regulator [Candidatus Thiosymbion oneisti]|uniref:Fur family transcriptional regulator n=1 Tax=Candidatus Thiosymbion oneisti TaxID=589554 RepID=UPI000A78CE14|nr:transcriptional repressor [Candidatus Thiosymbion oneisti]